MKILDTSNATATIVQPVKAETLNFLQTASKEIVSMVLNSVTGIYPNYNTTVIVVLTGCVGTLTAGVYNITAGVVWFNGEVFNVLANTFTPSGGQTPIFQLQTTQDTSNADPLTFSDQVQRNVHNIRQMQVIAGTSGSANYVLPYSITSSISCVYLGLSIPQIQAALNSEIGRATGVEQTLKNRLDYLDAGWQPYTPTISGVGTGTVSAMQFKYKILGSTGNAHTIIISYSFLITNGSTLSCTMSLPDSATLAGDFYGSAATFYTIGSSIFTIPALLVADPSVSTSLLTLYGTNDAGSHAPTYSGQIIIEIQ